MRKTRDRVHVRAARTREDSAFSGHPATPANLRAAVDRPSRWPDPAQLPSQKDIETIVERASKRILRFLQRRGVITLVTAPVASRSRQQAQAVAYRARPHYPVADCPQHFAPVARHPGRGTIKPCGEHSCNSSRDIHRVGATSEDGRSPGSGSCPARAT